MRRALLIAAGMAVSAAAFGDALESCVNTIGSEAQIAAACDELLRETNERLVRNREDSGAYVIRGIVWTRKGDYDRAIVDLDEGIRLNPKFGAAWRMRGIAHRLKGELDPAIADFTEAIRLNPKDALGYAQRGLARRAKGDGAGADADFRERERLQQGK